MSEPRRYACRSAGSVSRTIACRQPSCSRWTIRTGRSDGSWRQRSARCPKAKRVAALTTVFGRFGDDPITVDAAISGLKGSGGRGPERPARQQEPERRASIRFRCSPARHQEWRQDRRAADPGGGGRYGTRRTATARAASWPRRWSDGRPRATRAVSSRRRALPRPLERPAPGNAGGFGGRGRGGGRPSPGLFTEEPTALTGLAVGIG